jgi:hypothetical protein
MNATEKYRTLQERHTSPENTPHVHLGHRTAICVRESCSSIHARHQSDDEAFDCPKRVMITLEDLDSPQGAQTILGRHPPLLSIPQVCPSMQLRKVLDLPLEQLQAAWDTAPSLPAYQ